MREWWETRWGALASALFGLGVGGMISSFLSNIIGITVCIILVLLGVVILIREYRLRNKLLDEPRSKCKRHDHSWFNDERYEGVAYTYKYSRDAEKFLKVELVTKTCLFCGYNKTE